MKWWQRQKKKRNRLDNLASGLLAQAQRCLDFVAKEQLEEASLALSQLTASLANRELGKLLDLEQAQRLAEMLATAQSGACILREDSSRKLRRLHNVRAAKAVYSATSLPP